MCKHHEAEIKSLSDLENDGLTDEEELELYEAIYQSLEYYDKINKEKERGE